MPDLAAKSPISTNNGMTARSKLWEDSKTVIPASESAASGPIIIAVPNMAAPDIASPRWAPRNRAPNRSTNTRGTRRPVSMTLSPGEPRRSPIKRTISAARNRHRPIHIRMAVGQKGSSQIWVYSRSATISPVLSNSRQARNPVTTTASRELTISDRRRAGRGNRFWNVSTTICRRLISVTARPQNTRMPIISSTLSTVPTRARPKNVRPITSRNVRTMIAARTREANWASPDAACPIPRFRKGITPR